MRKAVIALLFFHLFLSNVSFGQDEDKIIHTRDGQTLALKKTLVIQCRKNYAAPPENKIITQICECQVNLLDRRYTFKQLKSYQKKYKERGLSMLMDEDTALQRELKQCTSSANDVLMLSIPEYRGNFINRCIDNLKLNSTKPLNDTLATLFCSCAADVIEKRKITIEKYEDLGDPSSFLYNEIAFKCGSPYLQASDFAKDWKPSNSADVTGDVSVDSVAVISLMGMHKIRITIGNNTRIWLLDSGASDLLVSEEFAKLLRKEKILSEMNFAGEGVYSLADNSQVSCKRYKIDSIRIGHFIVNNVIIATSNSVKEFLVGKSLLNKFSSWTLDNKNDLLILKR